jgi:hypothetical protein
MKASCFGAGLAVAILSIAPAHAAPKSPDDQVRDPAIKANVMDPDIRQWAPANATSYQDCQDELRAQVPRGPGDTWRHDRGASRQRAPCSTKKRVRHNEIRASRKKLQRAVMKSCQVMRAANQFRLAGHFPDPSRAMALRAPRRVDPAAGPRGLLDGREASAAAGDAFAFDRTGFAVFHFRSPMTVSFIRPHYLSRGAISRISAGQTRATTHRRRPHAPSNAAPTALEKPDWGRRR